MNLLQLPIELIPNITRYLPLLGIYNLSCCHSDFNNSFDIDWNKYFKDHLRLDVNLTKSDLVDYDMFYIKKLHYYQFYKNIINNNVWTNYDNVELNFMKVELDKVLLIINKVVTNYKDNSLYQKFIKKHKPILLHRNDLVAKYVGDTMNKTQKFLTQHLNRVLIIEHNELYVNDYDQFGTDAIYIIKKFNTNHNILVILC